MKRILLVFGCCLFAVITSAQPVKERLKNAFREFENDDQLKHAISSLYVIDAATGKLVFEKNAQVGLAGASTQKIVTAATAFELLGKDYRYKTVFSGNAERLFVSGFGDPTLGSWRYNQTTDTIFFKALIEGLRNAGISDLKQLIVYDHIADRIPPGGWINDDIGNYYGAGAQSFNWRENQYEMVFIPGKKKGDPALIDTAATGRWWEFLNECRTGAAGSGDNAYIYFIPGNPLRIVRGTVPAGQNRFSISGSDPEPWRSFSDSFTEFAAGKGFYRGEKNKPVIAPWARNDSAVWKDAVYTYYSPTLDSIIYWFLKKSVNLYGEALVKTFAREKQGSGSTDSGVAIVKKFWKEKGLDEDELNLYDGSGLSPLNRITTHAQVEVLKYARSKAWFPYFYDALPEYNGMKMKSGTISDVKGFCGYQRSKEGKEYIFSFLVNNYNGKTAAVVSKMYRVLDELK